MLSLAKWATICLGLLVAVLSSGGSLNAESYDQTCELNLLRLPGTFKPDTYHVLIKPNLHSMTFQGEVKVDVTFNGVDDCPSGKCSKAHRVSEFFGKAARNVFGSCGGGGDPLDVCDRRIVLHVGKLIRLDKVKVYKKKRTIGSEKDNLVESVCLDGQADMLAISLKGRASKGQSYIIHMEYIGKIGPESRGLYQSSVSVDSTNNTHYMDANTHFFPADARSAFPCFDEPHLKAGFQLTIRHQPGLSAISNTRVDNIEPWYTQDDGYQVVHFKMTPRMSTYNFAFAVGHYEPLVCPADERVVAYAPLGRSHEASFVLQTVCDAIPIVQSYFGNQIAFPLEKLDLVVTSRMRDPSRENWGMLVVTENFLLTDADTSNVLRAE